jgi:hypothetical protein
VDGNFHSDARKSVTFGLAGGGGRDEYGGWNGTLLASIGLKTSSRWNLEFRPSLRRSLSQAQYVGTLTDATATETFGARYLFAPLRQTTIVMETRLNLTFTPRLSFQLYAQPFISSGDYAVVSQLSAPRTYRFDEYTGAVPDSDFNLRSLRGTAVLRWEWRPGSTLFLAWQQTRSDFAQGVGDFDFGRDRQAMFAAEPDNIFVLKMNYWLSP